MPLIKVTLGNKQYTVKRAALRKWLLLEDIKEKLLKAAEVGDRLGVVENIYSYISAAIDFQLELNDLPWYEISNALQLLFNLNSPTLEFPFLKSIIEDQKAVWDYEGRTWFIWLHLIAEKYGWEIKYISELDIDNAIGLAQEIAIEAQLEREWEWQLNELAYQYDEATKKSIFKPLPRPAWMSPAPRMSPETKHKVKSNIMPVGMILTWKQDETPPS